MPNEENKIKYQNLRQQVTKLRKKIIELQNNNKGLINELSKTIKLNDEIIGNEELNNISENYRTINNTINNDLLTSIQNKLNS